MHLAADYGQLEVLEYLATKGADINAKDKHGISVILAAIWEGHTKCVKFLLAKVCTTHHGQIDLNKMLSTTKGTHQTPKWTPLGPQITEN